MARALLCGLSVALASAASCAPPARSPDTATIASGADLESGNPLATVHPLARQVQRYMLFVTLASYDDSLAPVPYFARRWRWSPDRRTLTFSLSARLRWHDGHRTTARDAAFTIDAARDPATGFPRYADLGDVDDVRAADDTTLVVRFASPQPRFPLVFCELPIAPAHLLASVPHEAMRRVPFDLAPLGNGPFRFVERRAGQRWVFARNADFPEELGGPPTLQRVVVAVVDEPATKFAGLVSNELDAAGIAPTMATLVARDPSLRVLNYPILFANALMFNVHRAPLDDVRVRRALSLAIDRRRIIDAALAGYGIPAGGPVPPAHPFALQGDTVRDSARAAQLLDAAGWRPGVDGLRHREGRTLTLQMLTVGSGDNAVEQLLQADLAAVGVRLEIRQRELGAFMAAVRAPMRDWDAVFTGVTGDVSLAYLSAMYATAFAGGPLDYAGYHTAHLDSLLARARSATSDSASRDAWVAVQRDLEENVPAAWVYHAKGVQGVSRRIEHMEMDLRGELVTISRWSVRAAPRVAAR